MGRFTILGQSRQKVGKTSSQPMADSGRVQLSFPAMKRGTNRRIMVQVHLGIKQDPIPKITNTKRAAGVAQGIEHLQSKFKTLGFNP
jgi:hypothetical protein